MKNKNEVWYAMWYITEKFQKESIETSIKNAVEYFQKKLGVKIKSIEVNKKIATEFFLVNGIIVKSKPEVLPNHILLEFEPKNIT